MAEPTAWAGADGPALVTLTKDEIARIASFTGGVANIKDVYPLAPLQEGILFHHLLGGEGDPYLVALQLSFDTRARLDRYLDALRSVVARHDILRTGVFWEGLRKPVQVVHHHAALPVEQVEVDPARGDVAEQLYARFDPRQFRIDLRTAPMLRAYITPDPIQQRWLLLLLQHHLTSDQVTIALMQEEIDAHLSGRSAQLPEPLPFRTFVSQLGSGVEEHEAYFRELLADVQEPTLPFELTDVRRNGAGMAQARRPVEPDVARRIRQHARRLGVSASSLWHLAWALVLAQTSSRDDVVFGTVLLGRMQAGAAARRVLGMFVNTLPVRLRLGDESVESLVRGVHRQLSQLLRHEQASLALAQRCSRVPAPGPLFSSLLNYRHQTGTGRSTAREGISLLYGETRTNYPLTLSIDDEGEGFQLTVRVDQSVDPQRVWGYTHAALQSVVGALEDRAERPARLLPVLPDAERREILVEWSATATVPGVDLAPSGVPVPERRVYLLNRDLAPVPVGVVGDLFLADAGVPQPHDPCAERLPDPFVENPAARMYQTGHRGKWLPDGTIVVTRRADTAAAGDIAALGRVDADAGAIDEAPAGEMEAAVARIWADILKVERVGRRSHFFELNGHSLLAVQVVARVREELEVEATLDDLFERPVLAAFVERMVDLRLEQFDEQDLTSALKLIREEA